jgi:hypothetical protein
LKPWEVLPVGGTPPNVKVIDVVSVSPTFNATGGLLLVAVKYVMAMPEPVVTIIRRALLETVSDPLLDPNHADLVGKLWLVRVPVVQVVWSRRTVA